MANKKITNAKRERLLIKCENLLLRGVNSPTEISDSLGVSYNTAKSYTSLVKERWVSYSTVDELQAKRQELIRKTEEIIKEAWMLKDTAKNNLEAGGGFENDSNGCRQAREASGHQFTTITYRKTSRNTNV